MVEGQPLKIDSWESFHKLFQKVMGFPDFYGANNNAWIDCMCDIDNPGSGMSKVTVPPGESLDIVVVNTEKAIQKSAEVVQGFIEIVAFVNSEFIRLNKATRLKIIVT